MTQKQRSGRPRTGHVYRQGDHWVIRIRLANGKRGKPQHLDPKVTESQARKLAAQASTLALRQAAAPSAALAATLSDETANAWLERWSEDRRIRGLATAEDAGCRWHKWIAPMIGHLPMRTVSREDLEQVVDRLDEAVRAKKIKPKTAINIWTIVQAAFRDAKNAKNRALRVRPDDPTTEVRGPDGGVVRSKPWLYPCEMSTLLACPRVPIRLRRIFALAAYLYPRRGELAVLTVDDIDLVGGVVLVHRAARQMGSRGAHAEDATKPTKTLSTHRVPIEPTLRPLLQVMVREARAAGQSRLIHRLVESGLGKQLRQCLTLAGIQRVELFADDETRAPLTFHDLRATGITWRAVRGDDALKIQRAAGHRSLVTTQRYIREAEVIGCEIGTPFPAIPAAVLATSLATLETAPSVSPSKQGLSANRPMGLPSPQNPPAPRNLPSGGFAGLFRLR